MVDLVYVAIALIVVLFVLWYRRPSNLPPGPRGIPLLGNLPFLGKWPERKMKMWSKTYGPVVSVRMGRQDWVILTDYESVTKAMVKQPTKFSGRTYLPYFELLTKGFGITFVDYGPLWKSQKSFGIKTLHKLAKGKRSMEVRILEEVSFLNNSLESKSGKAFDISDLIQKAVANNICNVVLGHRFDYNDPDFVVLLNNTMEAFKDKVKPAVIKIVSFVPMLINIPPFSTVVNSLMKEVAVLLDILRKDIKNHQDKFDENDVKDFVDAFLLEMKNETDEYFTHYQLLEYVRQLFSAGSGTTSSALKWGLLCLIHFPESQKKLRAEIIDVIGASGEVNLSCKPNMPYTNAFLQELTRFRTVIPLGVPHKTNEDADLFGYSIPKETTVLPDIWAVHNDPDFWKEPEKFKPERFIDDNGKFVESDHVIPFSVGPRHCLGEPLAWASMFLYLVSLVQKFEFLPDPDASELPTIDDGYAGAVFVPFSFKIVAKKL